MLTILKNRVYLGEVGWRGEWHAAEHDPLVERAIFDKAQALLTERGEEPAKRAAHGSDYLLTGLVVCSCGSRFTGTAATGRHRTYRYHTCGSRQRYGRSGCQAGRLPADVLDEAIVAGLLDLLADGTLIDQAVRRAKERAGETSRLVENELAAVDQELAQLDLALDRYLTSFERGTLPEEVCGPRVKSLNERATKLRERREEPLEERDAAALSAPSGDALAGLRAELETVLRGGSRAQVKAFVHSLVHEVRVEGPETVRPIYKVPVETSGTVANDLDEAVRAPSRLVGAAGLEPTTSTLRT